MGTSAPACEEMLAHVRVVRELGARTPATYLGEGSVDGSAVVLETYANLEPRLMRAISESAARLRGERHPHLVSVLSVEPIGPSWSVVTEHVDGVPLADVFFGMSLGARLRAVVDVLTALSALHVPISGAGGTLVHGGCLLQCAFVDKTGRTKLGFAYKSALRVGKDTYAPEALLSDEAAIDARTDVYGAGVLLWEAVSGRSLFGEGTPEDIVRKQLAGRVEKALPQARDRWARALLPAIERALATDPNARYATIAEMAAAVRIAVRARLMIHEDIIEEIWPAETKPKAASGVQPRARACAEEALQPEVVVPPASETRVVSASAIDVPAPAPEPRVAPLVLPTPPSIVIHKGFDSRLVIVGLGVTVILIAVVVLASVVRSRASVVPAPPAATMQAPSIVETAADPIVAPAATSTPTGTTDEPVVTPVGTATHAPAKTNRRVAKPHGTYDPSSI